MTPSVSLWNIRRMPSGHWAFDASLWVDEGTPLVLRECLATPHADGWEIRTPMVRSTHLVLLPRAWRRAIRRAVTDEIARREDPAA